MCVYVCVWWKEVGIECLVYTGCRVECRMLQYTRINAHNHNIVNITGNVINGRGQTHIGPSNKQTHTSYNALNALKVHISCCVSVCKHKTTVENVQTVWEVGRDGWGM